MSKYRFKTIEEFKAEDLWTIDKYSSSLDGYPNGWCEDGGMNKYIGQDVPDTFNVKMNCVEDKCVFLHVKTSAPNNIVCMAREADRAIMLKITSPWRVHCLHS